MSVPVSVCVHSHDWDYLYKPLIAVQTSSIYISYESTCLSVHPGITPLNGLDRLHVYHIHFGQCIRPIGSDRPLWAAGEYKYSLGKCMRLDKQTMWFRNREKGTNVLENFPKMGQIIISVRWRALQYQWSTIYFWTGDVRRSSFQKYIVFCASSLMFGPVSQFLLRVLVPFSLIQNHIWTMMDGHTLLNALSLNFAVLHSR